MAHNITRTDSFVGYLKGGWHGLGRVFSNKVQSPSDAVKEAGLDWKVEQWPMEARRPATLPPRTKSVSTHVLNVRSDTHEELGVVGAGYVPCQNIELAEFVWAVGRQAGEALHLETGGSLKGGRRVWFLLSGVQFEIGGNESDQVETYLLAANGHDGGLAIWTQPTSTRVVCWNTLHMAMAAKKRFIRIRHEGNLAAKVEDAKRALGLYTASVKEFRTQCDTLAGKDVKKEDLDKFFIEAWTRTQFDIPKNPKTEKESRRRQQASEAYTQFCLNVDKDAQLIGRAKKPSLWNGFNAFTEYLQHQKPQRGKGEDKRIEARVYNDMFGSTADAKLSAFDLALASV